MRFLQSVSDFPLLVSLDTCCPVFGLNRWGGRGLRFVPPDDESFTLRGDKQRVLYKGRRRSHRFTILGDTAFEYDCILNREPENNVVVLRMEGAEQFDFFRQPDFLKEPLLAGSYAVYKKETLVGEGTGKLCHIHHPEIIDATGRRCWGELTVVGNELRIIIPEMFLSEAVYPVIVDPTIGTTTAGSQYLWDNDEPGEPLVPLRLEIQLSVNRFLVSETIDGACTAYFYVNADEEEAAGRPVFYSDNGNTPLTRKSKNENLIDFRVTNGKPKGWRSGTFQSKGSIASGSYIWFGVLAEYVWYPRFDYGAKCYLDYWDDYDSIPDTYPMYSAQYYHNFKLSMYFTYTSAQNYIRTLTQGVTLSDSRKLGGTYSRRMSERVQSTGKTERLGLYIRICAMAADTVMNIKSLPAFIRSVIEKSTALTANKQHGDYKRQCAETIQPTMNLMRKARFITNVLEHLACNDFHYASLLIVRNVGEETSISDMFKLWKGFVRHITETTANSGEASHSAKYYRTQEDKVTAGIRVVRGLLMFVKIMTTSIIRDVCSHLFLKSGNEAALKSGVCRELCLTGGSMARIYAGQSALRLTLNTFIDLEGIQEAAIKYRRPDGVCGKFTAGIAGRAKGLIFHECIEGDITLSGWWSFWAHLTFDDGRTAAGQTAKVFVWEEGNEQ